MNPEKAIEAIFKERTTLEDAEVYRRTFTYVSKFRKKYSTSQEDPIRQIASEEYDELSRRIDLAGVQESCSVRNVLRTRRMAVLIIDARGEIDDASLCRMIEETKHYLYPIGPKRQYDASRGEHILYVLELIRDNKQIRQLLKQVDKPFSHKIADQVIRDTLQLSPKTSIKPYHAKRAVVAALLCYLRQSVGSCFGTAPSIVIHDEQPRQFLKDIIELFSTGALKRVSGGVEFSVPLSFSWGAGDIKKKFVVSRDLKEGMSQIWNSPGLINAMQTLGVIDSKTSLKEKRRELRRLIQNVIDKVPNPGPFFLVTVETLLKKILLNHYELTEGDVVDYLNRPQSMILGGLMMQIPSGGGGKGEKIAQYLQDKNLASSVYKGLADNALLKAWEFTIASFCETKASFSKWNLYSSLGLSPQESGGIGERLYIEIKQKLDECNAKVEEYQGQYEQVYAHVKMVEGRLKRVSTEDEARWLKSEYRSRLQEFHHIEELRNRAHFMAQAFANLFDVLIDHYLKLFPDYFQEVYNADLHTETIGLYDDSPAGFQLVYKHGRKNTSMWSKIDSPSEFIQSLTAFFIATENAILSEKHMKDLEKDLPAIITAIADHIKREDFLESSFYRMARYHRTPLIKHPLDHLDQVEKKPWSYTSGGTMDNLVACYYRREQKPTVVDKWIENPLELLVMLIDTLKQLPPRESDQFLQNPNRSMLMHSPTHAFLFKPGLFPFCEGWQQEAYTYTWVRDEWVGPRKEFVSHLRLNDSTMEFLIENFKTKIPEPFYHFFMRNFQRLPKTMTSSEFRGYVLDKISADPNLQVVERSYLTSEIIDSYLYRWLPVFPSYQIKERFHQTLDEMPSLSPPLKEKMSSYFEGFEEKAIHTGFMSAKGLQDLIKACLCLSLETTSSSINYHKEVARAMQKLSFAMPEPIRFADTNWVKDYFAFVVSPGTEQLELWRVDETGTIGYPMQSWREWLNGSRKDRKWGIYPHSYEYTI